MKQKSILALFLLFFMLISVCSCAENNNTINTDNEQTSSEIKETEKQTETIVEEDTQHELRYNYESIRANQNGYSDTTVYPMSIGSGKSTDKQNKPKVGEDSLFTEGFSYEGVYVGQTDNAGTTWYFYQDEYKEFTGTNLLSEKKLLQFKTRFEQFQSMVEKYGVKVYFVLCPNKSTIYPEYVPTSWKAGTNTMMDQVIDYLQKNTNIKVIDIRDSLLKEKEKHFPIYYEYDTHWNNFGGFAAYSEIMSVISEDFPKVRTMHYEDYRIDFRESYMKDQLWYLGYYNAFEEMGPVFTPLNSTGTLLQTIVLGKIAGIFSYAYTYPNGFHDWNKTSRFVNEELELAGAPRVFVSRDSFGISLSYFLKDSFSETYFSMSDSKLPSPTVIKNLDADIVIIEVAERFLESFINQK